MRRAAMLLAAALAGCGPASTPFDDTAGQRLERAALAAGLLPPDARTLTGVWARDGDRMCVAAPSPGLDEQRVGLVLDYGPGNRCVAQGTIRRDGDQLTADLGACTVSARIGGDRLVLPPDLDERCAALCRGNASLSALRVEHVSDSAAEAAAFRSPSGRLPCAS